MSDRLMYCPRHRALATLLLSVLALTGYTGASLANDSLGNNSGADNSVTNNSPATSEAFLRASSTQPTTDKRYHHIALLLPLSGTMSRAGEAIRDGFLAAYYASYPDTTEAPNLLIVDSTSSSSNITARIDQLVREQGVDAIVGPLAREDVSQLERLSRLPVPTLALNYGSGDSGSTAQLYELALNPEEEMRALAQALAERGINKLTLFTVSGATGPGNNDRQLAAFTHAWRESKRTLAAQITLKPGDNVITVSRSLFASSGAQPALLRSDALLLLTPPNTSRQLVPALRYYSPAALPLLIAAPGSFDPQANTAQNQDMNGTLLFDMPWLLAGHPLKASLQETGAIPYQSRYDRLYALGSDALLTLQRLQSPNGQLGDGNTGTLTIGPGRHIRRTLSWMKISDGQALPALQTSP